MIKVVISGSRKSRERDIISECFKHYFKEDVSCYDCNEHITNVSEVEKQEEINQRIRECDWYVLVANTVRYGQYTKMEWDTVVNSLKGSNREIIISVVKCTNPERSSQVQNIQDSGPFTFDDFETSLEDHGYEKQFYLEYTFHDTEFASLKNAVTQEINNALNKNIVMKVCSKSLADIRPSDIFANLYRTNPNNGFDDDFYLKRNSVDDKLDRSDGFVILTGAPASGKTRAVYEYLKRACERERKSGEVISRIIVVDFCNISAVLGSLERYEQWKNEIKAYRHKDISEYIFIFDQITDILRDTGAIREFNKLYSLAVEKLNARILATSLIEPFKTLSDNKDFAPVPTEIRIHKLNMETDYEFCEEMKRIYGEDSLNDVKRAVIGDYIPKLKKYNTSIIKAIEGSVLSDDIEAFVKAFNVVNLFRKGNIWPLGLVLAVAQKILSKKLDDRQVKDLLEFFNTNNILHEYTAVRTHSILGIRINHEQLYDYDGEQLKMLLPAHWTIIIGNDYIWQYLTEQKYVMDWTVQENMKCAIDWYCESFFDQTPIATLRRIIIRSPAVKMALKYRANTNFIQEYVIAKIASMYNNMTFEQKEMNELIATVLHRSLNMEVLSEWYDEFVAISEKKFTLDETVVAEIMGFAQYQSQSIQEQLKNFLKGKGWNFEDKSYTSIYYHKRLIQYMGTFEEIEEHMNSYVQEVSGQISSDTELLVQDKKSLIDAIVRKCKSVNELEKALEWSKELGLLLDKYFFRTLEKVVNNVKSLSVKENRKLLELLENFFTKNVSALPSDLICYYILKLSNSFSNSLNIYRKYEETLSMNTTLNDRCISAMLSSTKSWEFSYIYKFFFKDRKLIRKIPQISRNLLLKNLDFNSAMAALELLFDSSDADSTPDIYTMISLLNTNLGYLSSAKYKNHQDDKSNADKFIIELTYQNLLQILEHPRLKKIGRIDQALAQIIQCCISENQEQYVLNTYVKPSYLACHDSRTISGQDRNADSYWQNRFLEPEIAISRIRRTSVTDLDWIFKYTTRVMDNMFQSGKIIEPDIINCYFGKIVSLREGCTAITSCQYDDYRKKMEQYLQSQIKLNEYSDPLTRMECIIKDEFFYQAYYRVYPEKIVVCCDGKYIIDKNVLDSIPTELVSEKFIPHLLSGVAIFMDETALSNVEEWLIENFQDFCWSFNALRIVKKKYPEYKFHASKHRMQVEGDSRKDEQADNGIPLKKFISDATKAIKDAEAKEKYTVAQKYISQFDGLLQTLEEYKKKNPDYMPSYIHMHDLLKSTVTTSVQILNFLDIVFLRYGLPITATLWKSALEGIVKKIKFGPDKGNREVLAEKIDSLYQKYPDLILNDRTTMLCHLNIYSGKRKKVWFADISLDDGLLTVMDICELIRHNELFADNMLGYISLMKRYHALSKAMLGQAVHNETYGHFLIGCVKNYNVELSTEIKREICEMSGYSVKSKAFTYKLKSIYNEFQDMLNDMRTFTDVSHLETLL